MARKASLRNVARMAPHNNGSLAKVSPVDEFLMPTMSGHLSINDNVLYV